MTTNYFKTIKKVLAKKTDPAGREFDYPTSECTYEFFDDRSPGQIRGAYDRAVATSEKDGAALAVFRSPKIVGPWSEVSRVGAGIGALAMEPN